MLKSLPLVCKVSLFVALLLVTSVTVKSMSIPLEPDNHIPQGPIHESKDDVQVHIHPKERKYKDLGMKLFPSGSSLPDCMHACGACNPCKRVMVSFECSIAESCPVVYRCICKGKYYHVPSN